MLELIHNQKNNFENTDKKDAADENQSHQFIDDIIHRIKFVHMENIWNQQIENLFQIVNDADRPQHFKAL